MAHITFFTFPNRWCYLHFSSMQKYYGNYDWIMQHREYSIWMRATHCIAEWTLNIKHWTVHIQLYAYFETLLCDYSSLHTIGRLKATCKWLLKMKAFPILFRKTEYQVVEYVQKAYSYILWVTKLCILI